jgi:hypothetical protein
MAEPLYVIDKDHASLHISQGNAKIGKGIWSFSTLPGNEDHLLVTSTHGLLTDVPGTCSKYCDGCFNGGCYAVRDAKLHHNATIPAWAENTVLLRSGRLWDRLDTFLTLKNGKACRILGQYYKDACEMKPDLPPKEEVLAAARGIAVVKYFRIHVSGELEDADQLRRWNELAARHPETTFGMYTKNFDALAEFLDSGERLVDNFVVNVSEWHGVAKAFLDAHPDCGLNVFEYDDSLQKDCGLDEAEKARLAKVPHCPAVTKEGHHATLADGSPITCDRCGRCYRKTGQRTAVYAH